MNNAFQKIALGLIVLGIGSYFISESRSPSAFIPSILGLIVYGFVFLAGKFPNQHKHFAHANLFVFAMGNIFAYSLFEINSQSIFLFKSINFLKFSLFSKLIY